MSTFETAAHDALLLETVARHFPDAQVRDGELDLGFGGLRMAARVHAIREVGATTSASLFFQLWGGRIGDAPVFASASGYGESAEAAIVIGACNWTCVFGPVLRAGLAGEAGTGAHELDLIVDGQAYRVFVDGLDRAVSLVGEDATPRLAAARARLAGDAWLVQVVLERGALPVLAADRPTVISVFVSDAPEQRVVEVKVDGVDWPGVEAAFAGVPPEPPGAVTLMRELAVVVPAGDAAPLARESVVRTLRGLTEGGASRPAVEWSGWAHHRANLAEPLGSESLRAVERDLGELPPDYRDFLVGLAGFGAGPGYGLRSPIESARDEVVRGTFSWADGEEPSAPPRGVLPLAHAGCGVMWLLVLRGPHRGEVWCDARSSDGRVRRVAPSFSAWYRGWLTSAVRDAVPWIQWNPACCATAQVLSQLVTAIEGEGVPRDALRSELAKRLKPGALKLASIGSDYFLENAPLNPCHGCVTLASRFDLASNIFQVGREPSLGPEPRDAAGSRKPGLLARLADKLRPRN